MKSTLRASRAPLAALAVAFSAPVALAQSASDIISVPRIIRGAAGNPMRVRRDSAFARHYFAQVARAKAPQTTNCTLTKGALGAGCVTN